MRYWPYFKAKEIVTHSLPYSENERQRSINDFESCKSRNWKVTGLVLCITNVLAAFKGQSESDTLPAESSRWASTERQQFWALHDGYSKREMAASGYIWSFDRFYRLKHLGSLSCSIENELDCDCPGGCRETTSLILAYRGCQNLVSRCLRSVDAPLTFIVRMGQGASYFLFCLRRRPIQRLSITTINSHYINLTYRTQNRWCSVDAHFATGISATCNHLLWHRTSITVFWQSFYPLHVCFPLSLHCSLIVHLNISFKIYFKVSANCR